MYRMLMTMLILCNLSASYMHAMRGEEDNMLGQQLRDAVCDGNVSMVQDLIDQGALIDKTDDIVDTPLHEAAGKGHIECAKRLINNGANVNAKNSRGCTPLHLAHNSQIVHMLIQGGGTIDVPNRDGQPPLHEAAIRVQEVLDWQKRVARGCMDLDTSMRNNDVQSAIMSSNMQVVRELIKNKATVDVERMVEEESSSERQIVWEEQGVVLGRFLRNDGTIRGKNKDASDFCRHIWDSASRNRLPVLSPIVMAVFQLWPDWHTSLRLSNGDTPAHIIACTYADRCNGEVYHDEISLNLLRQYLSHMLCTSCVDLRNNDGQDPIDMFSGRPAPRLFIDCWHNTVNMFLYLSNTSDVSNTSAYLRSIPMHSKQKRESTHEVGTSLCYAPPQKQKRLPGDRGQAASGEDNTYGTQNEDLNQCYKAFPPDIAANIVQFVPYRLF